MEPFIKAIKQEDEYIFKFKGAADVKGIAKEALKKIKAKEG